MVVGRLVDGACTFGLQQRRQQRRDAPPRRDAPRYPADAIGLPRNRCPATRRLETTPPTCAINGPLLYSLLCSLFSPFLLYFFFLLLVLPATCAPVKPFFPLFGRCCYLYQSMYPFFCITCTGFFHLIIISLRLPYLFSFSFSSFFVSF